MFQILSDPESRFGGDRGGVRVPVTVDHIEIMRRLPSTILSVYLLEFLFVVESASARAGNSGRLPEYQTCYLGQEIATYRRAEPTTLAIVATSVLLL